MRAEETHLFFVFFVFSRKVKMKLYQSRLELLLPLILVQQREAGGLWWELRAESDPMLPVIINRLLCDQFTPKKGSSSFLNVLNDLLKCTARNCCITYLFVCKIL